MVTAVKEFYRESDSPQLTITLGHYIKQISLLKASMALEKEESRRKKEANDFLEMYSAHGIQEWHLLRIELKDCVL